ncbi:MAG: hypothetical protein JWM98_919 [Thermoleophilia bacterium]|nr:hypothetical protein [Thermoleophilia bacterium]
MVGAGVLALSLVPAGAASAHGGGGGDHGSCQGDALTLDAGCTTSGGDGGSAQRERVAPADYVGWVYLDLDPCARDTDACGTYVPEWTLGWNVVNGQWHATGIQGGWVYVSPYTGKWRWAWNQRSGWVALYDARFERR